MTHPKKAPPFLDTRARIRYATSKACEMVGRVRPWPDEPDVCTHDGSAGASPYRVTSPRPASVGRASGEPQCADNSIGSTAPTELAPFGRDFEAAVNLISACRR